MKRKVINISGNTMMISLPHKWVASNKVRKGDELDVEEKEKELLVKTGAAALHSIGKSLTVDIKDCELVGRRIITSSYRRGIKELNLRYANPLYLKSIQSTLSEETIGLEVIEQKNNTSKIAELASEGNLEFGTMLRRVWLLIKQIAQDSLESMQKSDFQSLENMHFRDRDVNKLANYCIRQLFRLNSGDQYQCSVYFHLIRSLEELGDQFQDLAGSVAASKLKVSKEGLRLYQDVLDRYTDFYGVFYEFDISRLEILLSRSKELQHKLGRRLLEETSDTILLHFVYNINERISRLVSTVIELNLEKAYE